jgi:cytochrome c553
MKKTVTLVIVMLVCASLAMAQAKFNPGTWANPTGGVTPNPLGFGIDKLGGHQNGGRGCVGCHAPHSGARGNGGTMSWNGTTYVSTATVGQSGDDVLWGQDLGPIYGTLLNFPGSSDYPVGVTGDVTITEASPARMITGVAMCLSCHDGNVAKGAMMTNRSFEQASGMLPATYGAQPIPTLLGADGGAYGNYENDHPVGQQATLLAVGHGAIASAKGWFIIDNTTNPAVPVIKKSAGYAGSQMAEFEKNYGLPLSVGARAGAGWALNPGATSVDQAYVVCTTCHTPHSMYTTSASTTNPIATLTAGNFPTFFFIAAPYNPGANTGGGVRASSATQFCRQCHFSGPGGANEASGISIPTAF